MTLSIYIEYDKNQKESAKRKANKYIKQGFEVREIKGCYLLTKKIKT